MTIKKAYTEIINLLEANKSATVSDIIEQAITIASAKTGGGGGKASNFHKDAKGNVLGIKCYYFKTWMNPSETDFGAKKTSGSGYNNMCKEGNSLWTKQNSAFKKGQADLLNQVATGEVNGDQVAKRLAKLQKAKDVVATPETAVGYETLEACLESQGVKLTA